MAGKSQAKERQARLAAALRANLKRRKAAVVKEGRHPDAPLDVPPDGGADRPKPSRRRS